MGTLRRLPSLAEAGTPRPDSTGIPAATCLQHHHTRKKKRESSPLLPPAACVRWCAAPPCADPCLLLLARPLLTYSVPPCEPLHLARTEPLALREGFAVARVHVLKSHCIIILNRRLRARALRVFAASPRLVNKQQGPSVPALFFSLTTPATNHQPWLTCTKSSRCSRAPARTR